MTLSVVGGLCPPTPPAGGSAPRPPFVDFPVLTVGKLKRRDALLQLQSAPPPALPHLLLDIVKNVTFELHYSRTKVDYQKIITQFYRSRRDLQNGTHFIKIKEGNFSSIHSPYKFFSTLTRNNSGSETARELVQKPKCRAHRDL